MNKNSMKRVETNGNWSLFCPNEAPNMHEVYGEEFEALYEKYEKEGRARKTIPAQKLWYAILESQIETGGPFMTYKDHANRTSALLKSCTHTYHCTQASPIRRTWELSSHRIFAPKSLNTRPQTKQPSAILPPLLSPPLSSTASTTLKNYTMSPR